MLLPELSVVLHPFGRIPQGSRRQAAASYTPVAAHCREARPLQYAHVLRSGRQGHRERAGKLTNRSFPKSETRQHRTPRRIRERVEGPVEHVLRVNHQV